MPDDWLASRLIERPRWHTPIERRACTVHQERPAQDRCDRCGRPYCADCLRHLERWRVCAACLGQLAREREAAAPGRRWQRLRPTLLAAAALLALSAPVFAGTDRLLGSPADQALAGAGLEVGARLHGGPAAPSHAALRLPAPLPAGAPPAVITVAGTGFGTDELVEATATLTGKTVEGTPLAEKLDAHVYGPVDGGNLLIKIAVSDNLRIAAPYRLHVATNGDQGSAVTLDIIGG